MRAKLGSAGGFEVVGATLIDGTAAPGRLADVLVVGDRIAEVGEPRSHDYPKVDGTGKVIAPGFIDTHSHDDYAVVLYPDMDFKVNGGVTTVVVGNCGHGAAPTGSGDGFAQMLHGDKQLPAWKEYESYFGYLERAPASTNVVALIGHGTIRSAVVGLEDRPPTPVEMQAMRAMISEGMSAGCVGLSSGLVYTPSRFADIDELSELATELSRWGGIYTSHIRNENEGLLAAIDEAIEVGRRAGVGVVISHLKAGGKRNHGLVTEALMRIDAAGPTVAADQYPYTAGSTGLAAVLSGTLGEIGPESVVIASTQSHPEWHGRSLTDLAAELEISESNAGAAVLEVEPSAMVVIHVMDEDDVQAGIRHPETMVGSDGVPTMDGQPHPRLYGTFARILGRYVRDLDLLPLERAVYKMTGRPAGVFGIRDRGVIREGAFADLVLFDPAEIADQGTYAEPHQYPLGIDKVWVNGELVVDDGSHTGARSGRPLRRQRSTGSA